MWLFTEGRLNSIVSYLVYAPSKRVHSPHSLQHALARVVRIFNDKGLRQMPVRVGEPAFYSPKPFIAVMFKPEAGGAAVSIVYDESDAEARAFAELLSVNLQID